VSYVEFDDDAVTMSGTRPRPTTKFAQQGLQSSGQKRPPRKDSEGNLITSKKLGEADSDRKPPPMFKDPSTLKDTYSDGGYGQPSAGKYDPSVKGYKTFGTIGQGPDKKGLKDRMAKACKARTQYVTVSAKQDMVASGSAGSETVLLEVGSYAFDTAFAQALKAAVLSSALILSIY